MKWTYEKLEQELWDARMRLKKDGDFIRFVAWWVWARIDDYESLKKELQAVKKGRGGDGDG